MLIDDGIAKGYDFKVWGSYEFVKINKEKDKILLQDTIDYATIDQTDKGYMFCYQPAVGEVELIEEEKIENMSKFLTKRTFDLVINCAKELEWI